MNRIPDALVKVRSTRIPRRWRIELDDGHYHSEGPNVRHVWGPQDLALKIAREWLMEHRANLGANMKGEG